jgi:glycerol-3-phosphate acyltransferase PlsY
MHPLWFIPIAFLCGSIPSGLLIGRAKGIDVRSQGSGNIGATNVGRLLGRPYFFLCFACDFLKSFTPVLLCGRALEQLGHFDVPVEAAWPWLGTMVASVLGNVFNPWLGFKGGKGVATSIGALMGVFPVLAVPGVAAFLVWITTLKITRYISAASIAAGLTLPLAAFAQGLLAARWTGSYHREVLGRALPFIGVCVLLAALVVWTHRANIKRLRAGTEPKAGARAASPARA